MGGRGGRIMRAWAWRNAPRREFSGNSIGAQVVTCGDLQGSSRCQGAGEAMGDYAVEFREKRIFGFLSTD